MSGFLSKLPSPFDNEFVLAMLIGTALLSLSANLSSTTTTKRSTSQSKLRELPVLGTDSQGKRMNQRRTSVAGESLTEEEMEKSNTSQKTYHEKSQEKRARVEQFVFKHLLFRNLDKIQKKEIIDAMFERNVPKGVAIINQGEEGDYFYVVDSGKFEILVNDNKVAESSEGGSFGELALLYGQPRAATVRAVEDSVVWAMDRITFRRIVVSATWNKRQRHQKFLKQVKLLQSLTDEEVAKVSDVLGTISFQKGQNIVTQGEEGDTFYIIEEGSVVVKKDSNEVGRLSKGEYFGEIALLTNGKRKATVTAEEDVECLALDKNAFTRLLGPCTDILMRNMENYKEYEKDM